MSAPCAAILLYFQEHDTWNIISTRRMSEYQINAMMRVQRRVSLLLILARVYFLREAFKNSETLGIGQTSTTPHPHG